MIGITGGIASGKSAVAGRLRHLGAVVLDADLFSRQVIEPHTPGWEKVRDSFPEVIESDHTINRSLLARIIFADATKRKILEGIIHPEVLLRLQGEAKATKREGKVVFAEVPLLYEVGWDHLMEKVWVVYVRPDVQMERLMKRDGISRPTAAQMIASQLPLEEKVKRATVVINNNGSLAETWQQVDSLWKEI
ncbi:MAG: dephospho-CoA kinase [Limnochordia bacterium]|nr:dephospho-CoA kinase [Limnochordia bacterium]